ncbi:cutinase family protein [Corynebacterium sp. S7]
MKRLSTLGFATIAALIVSASTTVIPAKAQEAGSETGRGTCPSVQMIAVNDVADSALDQADAGFLADVSTPVLVAANEEGTPSEALDAGFRAPAGPADTEDVPTGSGGDSDADWKPDVWGEAGETADASSTSWKPDVWGETTATAETSQGEAALESLEESVEESESALATETPSATAEVQPEAQTPEVGRTIISVQSTDDTRAYIPGVTGPDSVPSYNESITRAVSDTESVLDEIDEACPGTKVILLGSGQGAQAASIVSKRIGAGEVFPADKVLGVSLFADPSRGEDQPVVASGDSAPAGATGQWDAEAAPGAGVATVTGETANAPEGDFGDVADRTVSWCAEGDTSCALPEGAPLRTLVANTAAGTEGKAPEQALSHVTDVLAPAVLLGSVETLASDVEFGDDGFTFSRASSPDSTLVGRIATESEREVPQDEMEQRLLASGMQIGGMALAAGVTVAKEMVRPENIAQIAAASAVSPAAGVGAALVIGGGVAATELISPRTMTTGAVRLADEAQSLGIEDEGLAQAAVDAAVGSEVSKSNGAYSQGAATATGETASDATTGWLLDVVGTEIGRELGAGPQTGPATYDTAAIAAALKEA